MPIIRTEESYRIVASSTAPHPADSDPLVTIPSATIADKLKIQQLQGDGDATTFQDLYWSDGVLETDGFSIIGFAGEFCIQNEDDDDRTNKNCLIMVLATAQAQRKALALKPSIIMGATIACSNGRLQIFLHSGQVTTRSLAFMSMNNNLT